MNNYQPNMNQQNHRQQNINHPNNYQPNMNSVPSKKKGGFFYRFLFVFLCVVFVLNLLLFLYRIRDHRVRYATEYSTFLREADKSQYPDILDDVSQNEAMGANSQHNTEEFAVLADYYLNYMLLQAYQNNGESEKAEETEIKLDELEQQITSPELRPYLADIREKITGNKP